MEEILSHLTNPPVPDLEIALDVFSKETHAFATCPDKSRHYKSVSGRHAEWQFNDDIRANLKAGLTRRNILLDRSSPSR